MERESATRCCCKTSAGENPKGNDLRSQKIGLEKRVKEQFCLKRVRLRRSGTDVKEGKAANINIKGLFLKAFRNAKYQTVPKVCFEMVDIALKINARLKLYLNASTRKWLLETEAPTQQRSKLLLFERVKECYILPRISLGKKIIC